MRRAESPTIAAMDTFAWIVAGSVLGWLTYSYWHFNSERGVLVSMAIGAMGALFGAKLLAPMFVTVETVPGELTLPFALFACAAAAACLALGNVVQQRWNL